MSARGSGITWHPTVLGRNTFDAFSVTWSDHVPVAAWNVSGVILGGYLVWVWLAKNPGGFVLHSTSSDPNPSNYALQPAWTSGDTGSCYLEWHDAGGELACRSSVVTLTCS